MRESWSLGENMGLDKAIKYGKEKRKPYIKAKAVFVSCRNHKGCPACAKVRRIKDIKRGGRHERVRAGRGAVR